MKHENKVFCIFLLIHLLVWSCLGLVRTILPTDSLEGIYWGSLHDFGTPKHPPLAGWITYLAYIPFKSDFSIYFISQFFITLGFIYIWKLAKCFLDNNSAILSVIILEGCWCYSYVTGYYGFNPDVLLLFFLPALAYYFYKCMNFDDASNWIKLGIIVGFSFLNKYQTALVIFPMILWAIAFKRETFKNKYFYISIMIAFFLFLPHLIWLIQHDFYSLLYFDDELKATSLLNHITAPLFFLVMQLAVIIGSVLIFGLARLVYKKPLVLRKNIDKKVLWFMLLFGFLPLVFHLCMGFIEGGTMRPRWGYEFMFMTGIIMFYFFPSEISKKEFDFITKASYTVMLIVFLSLGILLTVEKNYRSRYPVNVIFSDLKDLWYAETGVPLKYLGGYIEWTLPLTIYGDTHPKCILDNHGYKDPWIAVEDLKKSGVLIIDRKLHELNYHTKISCPYLPDDYEIQPRKYNFTLYNFFGKAREYEVFYIIVPPVNE